MKSKFKRVFHHWEKCEEYKSQMWKAVAPSERAIYIEKSTALLADSRTFEQQMKRLISEWPNSMEATLTATQVNQQAWMGAAGCAIHHNAPEELTRTAWRLLTSEQQDLANAAADRVIALWATNYKRRTNA